MKTIEAKVSLLGKFCLDDLTVNEKRDLDEWTGSSTGNRLLVTELSRKGTIYKKLVVYMNIDSEALWEKVKTKCGMEKRKIREE